MCPVQYGKASLKGRDSVRGLPLLGAMTAHPVTMWLGGIRKHLSLLCCWVTPTAQRGTPGWRGWAWLPCIAGVTGTPQGTLAAPRSPARWSKLFRLPKRPTLSHRRPLLPVPGRPSFPLSHPCPFPLSHPSLGASLKSRFPQQSCGEDQLLWPPRRCLPESPTLKALRSGPVIQTPGLGAPRPPRHPPWSLSSTHLLIPGSQPPPQWLQEFKWLSLEDSGENCFHVALSAQAPGAAPPRGPAGGPALCRPAALHSFREAQSQSSFRIKWGPGTGTPQEAGRAALQGSGGRAGGGVRPWRLGAEKCRDGAEITCWACGGGSGDPVQHQLPHSSPPPPTPPLPVPQRSSPRVQVAENEGRGRFISARC